MPATMIPRHPKEFDPKSREDEVFEALQSLPQDYYVFHSVALLKVFRDYDFHGDMRREERQTDFVVLNPKKGIVCIEAKNWRNMEYRNGINGCQEGWYINGELCQNERYSGPFDQVESFVKDFRDRLLASDNQFVTNAIRKMKVHSSVWLIPTHQDDIDNMNLPLNAKRRYILSFEDLHNPEQLKNKIDSILDSDITSNGRPLKNFAPLNGIEATSLISAIAPNFTISFDKYAQETNKIVFNQLLKQQYVILDFLKEQNTAVISGTAGTGKTMLAIKKAVTHAKEGEPVLYLCFNSELAKQLSSDNDHNNLTFMTLDAYCTRLCNRPFQSDDKDTFYQDSAKILDRTDPDRYEYKHVILDEGQDICINPLIENVLETIKTIVGLKEGSFYIFYDKMQLMPYTDNTHDGKLPSIINDADCRLTLYRNCRNTKKIANSATVTITPEPPMMMETAPDGDYPSICYPEINEIENAVSNVILQLNTRGYTSEEIVVLSLKGEQTKTHLGERYLHGAKYTTINKFKGLESRAVIIVDFNQHTFDSKSNCTLYYVAASRAKEKLYIVTPMTDNDATTVNNTIFNWYIQNTSDSNARVPSITNRRTFEQALGLRRFR